MARVQLVMSDADRDRFVDEARREGMSLSAWIRAAARERLEARQHDKLFTSEEDYRDFFRRCAEIEEPEREPDWEEHLAIINESKSSGISGT